MPQMSSWMWLNLMILFSIALLFTNTKTLSMILKTWKW